MAGFAQASWAEITGLGHTDIVDDITRRLSRHVFERNERIARWGLLVYMNTDWDARPLWFRCIQGPGRPGFVTAPHCKLVLRWRWP